LSMNRSHLVKDWKHNRVFLCGIAIKSNEIWISTAHGI